MFGTELIQYSIATDQTYSLSSCCSIARHHYKATS